MVAEMVAEKCTGSRLCVQASHAGSRGMREWREGGPGDVRTIAVVRPDV